MSVYVGIDVHRKRSQVAVIDSGGEVLANRNVPNGVQTILGVIGGRPAFGPFGWGWLLELLEDYGFSPHLAHPLQCKAIASARLKNDKGRRRDPGAAAARGPSPGGVDRAAAGAPAPGAAAAPGPAGPAADPAAPPDPRGPGRPRPGPAGRVLERPGPGLARLAAAAGGLAGGDRGRPGHDRRAAGPDRPARPRGTPARQVRPAGQGPDPAARRRPVHRAGHPGRDRRHHPVRLGAQARLLGRAHPDRPRVGPHRPARPHLQAWARRGCGGSCARQRRPPSGTPTSPPATRPSPAAAARRSPPPRSPASCSPAPGTCSPTPSAPHILQPPHIRTRRGNAANQTGRGRQAPGELAYPHEPAMPRSMT